MKKSLIGFLTLLSLSTLSYADTSLGLKCDSDLEWVLGGVTRSLTVEIDTKGNILSGSFDGEKYRTSSNSLIWFEGQENPSSRIPKYGSFEYSFKNLELKNLKVGKSIEVIVEGRDYLASFREAARCKRIR
jgi:hypothetical protein